MNRFVLLFTTAPLLFAAIPACTTTTSQAPGAIGEDADGTTPADGETPDGETPDGETPDKGDPKDPVDDAQCTAARRSHLVPIAEVSTAEVKVLSTADGVTTLYVDASAGGVVEAAKNPRVYIKLTGEKIEVTDEEAFDSTAWDLALKRVDLYTNGGDAGPGKGGAVLVAEDFDDVTAADADAATIESETFFDEECNGIKDQASFIVTTMSGWYDYAVGGGPSVKQGHSFIIRGADGASRYKLGIVSYTGTSDGKTDGLANGRFIIKVAPL